MGAAVTITNMDHWLRGCAVQQRLTGEIGHDEHVSMLCLRSNAYRLGSLTTSERGAGSQGRSASR
jgi:hypothetical protein